MPIYAYACGACGHAQDHLQKLADAPIAVCPECGSDQYAKQLSAPQFQLKGGGWYVTDFRDSGKKDGKKSEPADAKGGDAKTDAKADGAGDGKSDAKSDSKTESSATTSTPAAPSSGSDAKAA